jgi:hypothetical protein
LVLAHARTGPQDAGVVGVDVKLCAQVVEVARLAKDEDLAPLGRQLYCQQLRVVARAVELLVVHKYEHPDGQRWAARRHGGADAVLPRVEPAARAPIRLGLQPPRERRPRLLLKPHRLGRTAALQAPQEFITRFAALDAAPARGVRDSPRAPPVSVPHAECAAAAAGSTTARASRGQCSSCESPPRRQGADRAEQRWPSPL